MKCELYDICNCRSAVCFLKEPDETCYYYRYFRDLIFKGDKDYKALREGAISFQTYYINQLSKIKEKNFNE